MTRIITLAVIAFLAGIDQIIKMAVVKNIMPIGEKPVLKGILRLRYVENTGAIFGSLKNSTTILIVLTSLILAGCIFLLMTKKIPNKLLFLSLLLIVAGGIGNLIDRVARGYVIDYIEVLFVDFAIFNFADCFVTVGAFSMMGYLIVDLIKESRNSKNEEL